MILNDKSVGEIIEIGEHHAKKATINSDKLAKLQYMLTTGLYGDPVGACIVELVNNSMDSIIESGKNIIENPAIVEIHCGYNNYWIEWRDQGLGMDLTTFETVVMSYLTSTKEDSNDTIGHFGIGAKSTLSLERPAQWTIRKNGKEWKLLFYLGAEFAEYDLINECDTDQPDGVTIRVNIKDNYEYSQFCRKAKEKLVYYDGVVLIINNTVIANTIYRYDKYQVATMNRFPNMHLSLKDVYYDIDWIALGVDRIDVPICLRFTLEDGLLPTPSRERLIYNESTKRALIQRIKEVSEEIILMYNDTVQDFDNFVDVVPYMDVKHPYLELNDGYRVEITPLKAHSITPIRKHSCSILNIRPALYYKSSYLLKNYEIVIIDDGYTSSKKYIRETVYSTIIKNSDRKEKLGYNGSKLILFKGTPSKNETTYLRELYRCFVIINKKMTDIANVREIYRTINYSLKQGGDDLKALVAEQLAIEKQLSSLFIDHTNIQEDPEYIEWYEEKKRDDAAKRRANKEAGIVTGLNKKVGDVTIGYAVATGKYKHPFTFKKNAYPISKLHKNKWFTILFTEPDRELAINWAKAIENGNKFNTKYKVGIAGVNEIKKIDVHNFKTIEQMMTEKSRVFSKIVTAQKIHELLEKFKEIWEHDLGNRFLKGVINDISLLKTYEKEHFINIRNIGKEFYDATMNAAEDNKLWDLSIMDVYNRVNKEVEMIEFISFIKKPSRYEFVSEEDQKKLSRLINMILVTKKVRYDAFENFVLVEKVIEPVVASIDGLEYEKEEEENIEEEEEESIFA